MEVFCGRANLSKRLRARRFQVISVDHVAAKAVPIFRVDITNDKQRKVLEMLLNLDCILYVHFAPPCGTASAAIFFLLHSRATVAIKPCRSSRSKLRGEFGIPKHLQNRKQKHHKATNTPKPKHNTKQKEHGKCLECETRGEKRVKRPKRPNALICRTPGGSIRYPLSSSLGMMLISHSIVSIPASPSRFAI